MVTVKFLKPTLNYAAGDVVELEEDYLKEVVEKYINKYFKEDKSRYEVVKAKKEDK